MPVQSIYSIRKSLEAADATRHFSRGSVSIIELSDRSVALLRLMPGWKWSVDMKPVYGTESCDVTHFLYVINGRLAVRMNDGHQFELRPGDCAEIAPGHDSWVVGEEPFEAVDFGGAEKYTSRLKLKKDEDFELEDKWFLETD